MSTENRPHLETRIGRLLQAMIMNVRAVIVALVLISIVLLAGGISSAPETDASFSPPGEEFDTLELVDRTFRPSTTEWIFIVEDEDGDALDQESLLEWKQNSDKLRADPEFSGALSTYFDGDAGLNVTGTYSLADAVDAELRESGVAGGLAAASNDQTKQALSAVLSEDRPTVFFRDLISVHGKVETATVGGQEIDLYTAPVFLATIRVDHSAFPVDLENESDPATRTDRQQDIIDNTRAVAIEEYARDIQDILRGDQQFIAVWGLAIDDNLTSDESFEATVPFLLGAFTLILLLVGAMLRSYWAAALAAVMLGLALLWARMISNLLGFEDSIILDVIVPIATISFGVDFMIHAVGRCREELAGGQSYRSAYVIGIAAVGGALVLALSTSSIAFGSNATSGIDAIIQFGFGATVALASAFLMLGLLAPLFLLRIEEALAGAPPSGSSPRARAGSWLRVLVASLLGSLMIVSLIAVPAIGAASVAGYALILLVLPILYTRRHALRLAASGAVAAVVNAAGQHSEHTGNLVAAVVRNRFAALAVIALITVAAAFGASKVGTKTEFSDFLPSSSDFIISINKATDHSRTVSPGGTIIYVEGSDLANPVTLRAAAEINDLVTANSGDLFVKNPDGSFAAPTGVLDVVRAAVSVDFAADAIEDQTGVPITDSDSDGFPDTAAQVEAIFSFSLDNGLPADEATSIFTADEISQIIARRGDAWTTVLSFPMQADAAGDAAAVDAARTAVEAGESELLSQTGAEGLTLTTLISGELVTQQIRLDAITSAMLVAVPLAMLLCLVVAGLVMRSARLAIVSVVPIALVIVWLLGFMYAFDFSLNVVTATIAAISVGIGIDYSIHFTMRFREELRSAVDRISATHAAASGTGTSLILSATTSIVGFLLLALAPMPVFAAYGLLTAVMVAFSLIAALTVLPSLLYLVTPATADGAASKSSSES